MLFYFHSDGSHTISRVTTRDRFLELEAVRIVEIRENGAVVVRKDRFGQRPGELLGALPLSTAHAE